MGSNSRTSVGSSAEVERVWAVRSRDGCHEIAKRTPTGVSRDLRHRWRSARSHPPANRSPLKGLQIPVFATRFGLASASLRETVSMSATYAYLASDLQVERTIAGVRKVKVKDGCVSFLGRKKRPLLVLTQHNFGAAWRGRIDVADRGPDGLLVLFDGGRIAALPRVDETVLERDSLGRTIFHVLTDADDDLPVAVLSAQLTTMIAGS